MKPKSSELNETEIEELDGFLARVVGGTVPNIEALDGFFAALACCPNCDAAVVSECAKCAVVMWGVAQLLASACHTHTHTHTHRNCYCTEACVGMSVCHTMQKLSMRVKNTGQATR